jgi:hypothetical protein
VGKGLERIDDDAGIVVSRPAVVAFLKVRTKRGDAESGFAVDQEVDLVGEEVSVIHDLVPMYGRLEA